MQNTEKWSGAGDCELKNEMKDLCIELAIDNVSPKDNNVKIKLNLKLEEICRYCSPNFL